MQVSCQIPSSVKVSVLRDSKSHGRRLDLVLLSVPRQQCGKESGGNQRSAQAVTTERSLEYPADGKADKQRSVNQQGRLPRLWGISQLAEAAQRGGDPENLYQQLRERELRGAIHAAILPRIAKVAERMIKRKRRANSRAAFKLLSSSALSNYGLPLDDSPAFSLPLSLAGKRGAGIVAWNCWLI